MAYPAKSQKKLIKAGQYPILPYPLFPTLDKLLLTKGFLCFWEPHTPLAFQRHTPSRPPCWREGTAQRTATTPGISRPTLFEQCVSFLTFHIINFLNMEDIVRRGLRFIVLIREELKVQSYADELAKTALSPKLFQFIEWWSGQSRLLAWHPVAQPTATPNTRTHLLKDNKFTQEHLI